MGAYGVSSLEPGFTKIKIEPEIGNLDWAKGSVATVHGMVEVSWWLDGDDFKMRVNVPTTVTALIKMPDGAEYTVNGEGEFYCKYKTGQ